jgi:hypothetical protein
VNAVQFCQPCGKLRRENQGVLPRLVVADRERKVA